MSGFSDGIAFFFVLLYIFLLCAVLVVSVRSRSKSVKNQQEFAEIAQHIGLVESSVSSNEEDYTYFYDSFTLSNDSQIWQTPTENPRFYINPFRKNAVELFVKGNYEMPWIQLEGKHNKTHIKRRWGNQPRMISVQLEGNFNKFFELRCEPNQTLIALQIFSPEIMERMIKDQMYYDVEIRGSSIMIATDSKKLSVEFVQKLLNHAATLDGLVRATQKVII